MKPFALSVVAVLTAGVTALAQSDDFNTQMMKATFRIEGTNAARQQTTGTAFILTRPAPGDPKKTQHILVTAEHVLGGMVGDEARSIHTWQLPDKVRAVPLHIRKQNAPLWKTHPKYSKEHAEFDIAVMYFSPDAALPIAPLPLDLLASDDDLRRSEIHAGDSIRAIGFPYGKSSNAGYGIVRGGCIASFPLLPTKDIPIFNFDAMVHPGCSGGPVYISDNVRSYDGKPRDKPTRLILGMTLATVPIESEIPGMRIIQLNALGLARAVHAGFIREAIDLLPAAP